MSDGNSSSSKEDIEAQEEHLYSQVEKATLAEQLRANAAPTTVIGIGFVLGVILAVLGSVLANVPTVMRNIGTIIAIGVPVAGLFYLFGFGVWTENVREAATKKQT